LSVVALKKILARRMPDHVAELRMSNLKATKAALQSLFEVVENATLLKKVRLSFLDIKSDPLLRSSLAKLVLNAG
jgi:hypothetical protein